MENIAMHNAITGKVQSTLLDMRRPRPEPRKESPGRAGGIAVAGPSKGPYRDGEKSRAHSDAHSSIARPSTRSSRPHTRAHGAIRGRADRRKRQTATASPAEPGGPPCGLGTEFDKRSYFMRRLQGRVELREFPRLTFGNGAAAKHRYFPDKMPIGVQPDRTDHVFMYLVTSPVPM